MNEEHEVEPIPGLPHHLPPGERILWQGSPRWRGLASHAFYIPWFGAYFAVLAVARGVVAVQDGQSLPRALWSVAQVVPLAGLCLGVLALLAWANARATIYTLTTRRVVMRFGVALPMTFNLPFKRLAAAVLRARAGGHGDIALELLGTDRIAWLHLWPHARPWRFAKAQPMLRAIPEAPHVAALLAEAMQAWSATEGVPVVIAAPASPAPEPVKTHMAAQVALGPELATQARQ